jgi:hypothetical protein
MAKLQMLVFSNPAAGRDDEYNRWYDEVHLGEVLEIPACSAAQRFELTDVQMRDDQAFRYLAIYEFDCEAAEAKEALAKAAPGFDMSDALGESSPAIFRPITDHRTG